VETILTLLLISVVGAALVQFTERTMVRSVQPLQHVSDESTLQDVMEAITRDYKDEINSGATFSLSTFTSTLNSLYGAQVDSLVVEDVCFSQDAAGDWAEAANCAAATTRRVSLTLGDYTLSSLFTE
jgi:hypothetical protein